MREVPSGESLITPISKPPVPKQLLPFPPPKFVWKAPVEVGNPWENTMPPPNMLPSGPYVAVKPQLSAWLPVNEQKISVGSIIKVVLVSYSLILNLTMLFFTEYFAPTSVFPFSLNWYVYGYNSLISPTDVPITSSLFFTSSLSAPLYLSAMLETSPPGLTIRSY